MHTTISEELIISCNSNSTSYMKGNKFIKGPIPFNWIIKAGKLPGKTLHLAIQMWFLVGVLKNKTIRVNLSKISRELRISRMTLIKSMKALENAGLITVQRIPGQKSIVTINDIE